MKKRHMTIFDAIKTRRSITPAFFNDKQVENSDILKLLDAANCAPTHRLTEPWRFKVIQGEWKEKLGIFLAEKYKETASKFSEFKYAKIKEKMERSSAVIGICMQRDPKKSLPEWEEIAATAMAVQNMWLTTTALDLGGYWSSPSMINHMDEFFDLKEGERCLGFFYLGHYDGPRPERVPGPIEEKVVWM